MISILDGSLGSQYFLTVANERTNYALHLERTHLKAPGCSLVWNALSTKFYLCFCCV